MAQTNDLLIIVGCVSDDPFSIDIAYLYGQTVDISDLVSLKNFSNSEFCPRFLINDEKKLHKIGKGLTGKTVVICSTASHIAHSRNHLAMRNMLLATAAKENGAKKVILVEPDLFYSAQDRGPHRLINENNRSDSDLKKFDGQPFSSNLYARLLKESGIDSVVTVHNHSKKVQNLFSEIFPKQFHNLLPYDIYADYLLNSNFISTAKKGENLVLCSPDQGALEFTENVFKALNLPKAKIIIINKKRIGERQVRMSLSPNSQYQLEDIKDKDVIILDDMVRTGNTVIECCRYLREGNPRKICFGVSHFHSSSETREVLNSKYLDEILTLNTIPSILNKDMQGRLRKKMVVLKIEKWIARFLLEQTVKNNKKYQKDFYAIDISAKNPRSQTKK